MAGLASEGLALISGSAGVGSIGRGVYAYGSNRVPQVCARFEDVESAVRKYTNEERGGSRDPVVRRSGAGRGQLPTRSKIFVTVAISRSCGRAFLLV